MVKGFRIKERNRYHKSIAKFKSFSGAKIKQLSSYAAEVGDLWQDGIYLLKSGKAKLAWNYIYIFIQLL